jgi:hypothetical protein
MNTDKLTWVKSSRSGSQGDCVEVAATADGRYVRDSKNPGGAVLQFSAVAWREFTDAVKEGRIS